MLAFERTGRHNPCRTIPRQRPRSATRHLRRSPGDSLLSSCYCHGAKIIAGGFAFRAGPRSRKRLNHIPLSDKYRSPPSITHTRLSHMNPAAMANPGFLQGKPLSLPKRCWRPGSWKAQQLRVPSPRTKPLRGGKDPGLVHKPSASATRPIESDFAPCLYQRAAPCYSSAWLRLAAASVRFFTSRSPGTLPRTRPLPSYSICLKQKLCPSRLRPPSLHPQGRRGLS